MTETGEEYFEEDDDLWEEDERVTITLPTTEQERIELLRRALNFPDRPGTNHAYNCCTASDLEELEGILKRHFRK